MDDLTGGGLRRFRGAGTIPVVVGDDLLRRYLSSLAKEELVRRLLALAERDEVTLMALRAEAAAAAGTFDLAAFRKELTARLRESGFVDWRGAASYARRADAVLDVIERPRDAACRRACWPGRLTLRSRLPGDERRTEA